MRVVFKKYILVLILLLAGFLRLYRLGDYPALNADEAAIGYNAYSLIETGKDEHGNLWPIHFQSFNDYKPGLYFYLVLPFVKFMGLNEWAVRIPNATLGVLTVLVVYFLAKELNAGLKLEIGERDSFGMWKLEILAPALLAISPWHIHFSRGGWEVSAATFFITTGVWLFLKAANKNFKFNYLALSVSFFVFSLYTYHAARIIVPLLTLGLILIYGKDFRRNIKNYLMSGVFALILLVPLIKDMTGPAGISRAGGVGLFTDPGPVNRVNEQRGEHGDYTNLSAKILHNKFVNYSLAFSQNYGEHFWGEFLFLSGDEIQRNRVPETGQMHIYQLIFLIVGLFAIAKNSKGWSPILFWLAISPVAAALTFQSPHALRANNMVIPLTIVSAHGLATSLTWLKKQNKYLKVAGNLTIVILISLFFLRYVHMYWVHMSNEYPFSSQYGVKELVSYVKENEHKYEQIMVTDRYDQPYILFLFYLKYPAGEFQIEHTLSPRDMFGFSTVREFDKYVFTSVTNWDRTREEFRGALIVGTDEEILEGTNVIKEIFGSNGYKYFQIVAN